MKDMNDGSLNRRSFFKMAGVAAAAVAASGTLAACSPASQGSGSQSATSQAGSKDPFDSTKGGNTPATIGYWGGSPCELPVYIAIIHNYFQEAGIEPNIIKITSDTSILLANDEIDCFEATPGDFMALYNGENMKLLDTIHVGCWSGVTKNPNIKNCADLVGKNVGTSMINGPAYTEVQALCARQGGDNSKINWVTYSGSLLKQALDSGEVDAVCGGDASIYPIKETDSAAQFFYISAQELGEYYCCFIGCNSHSLEKRPELGDKLTMAFAKAIDYINQDPDRAINESMEQGYASSKFPDIQRKLTRNYMFNHGNKDDMFKSVKERWQELYDAHLLAQAPADTSKVSTYLDGLTNQVIDWHGDVAVATADKNGAAANLAKRGSAYVN